MIAAGIIIVLAWFPGADIENFQPLGFEFDAKSKLSAWVLLLLVLVYYILRFGADCRIDYKIWFKSYAANMALSKDKTKITTPDAVGEDALLFKKHFWVWDFSPPAFMAIAGVIAAGREITALV